MFKYGLKIWSVNIDNYFKEAQRLSKKGLLDYIELYYVPDTYHTFDIWKFLDVPYVIHAPHYAHGINLADSKKKKFNNKIFQQVFKFADKLNSNNIIVHCGVNGSKEEIVMQLNQMNDSRILVENLPACVHDPEDIKFFLGITPDEIGFILKNTDLGFVLDIGHAIATANSINLNHWNLIDDFLNLNPVMYHLSDADIDTSYDDHLNIGDGNLDFNKLKTMLVNGKNISIETQKKSEINLSDYVTDFTRLKALLG